MIKPLEETNPELAAMFMDIVNGKLLAHVEGTRVFQTRRRAYTKHDHRNWHRRVFREVMLDVGRNDLCPCGSGKKYKKCCLRG